ncbi:MAG TPA: HEAT repeat domain-containing protein [Gemmataceae bacterium]|nr:HEAT repeat domain-containing protein [Gemmataceae bacterium]
MRRTVTCAVLAALGLVSAGRGGEPCEGCKGCKDYCKPIPVVPCPDCCPPCEHRLCLCVCGTGHAEKLIDQLCAECCCERIRAAKKLGCRLHADFCECPDVLTALITALLCDPCWEVREAAAWSLAGQGARTEDGLLALYISARMDPHYMVRAKATFSLDQLTLGRLACYRSLFRYADGLIKGLRTAKFKPGADKCRIVFNEACHLAGPPPAAPAAPPAAEPIPPPKR